MMSRKGVDISLGVGTEMLFYKGPYIKGSRVKKPEQLWFSILCRDWLRRWGVRGS